MQETTYEYSEELPLNIKEQLRSIILSVRNLLRGKSIIFTGIFLPWYILTITFFPVPLLWWILISVSFIVTILMIYNPRISLYIIGPCILLFNTLYFWLPWPSVKIIYAVAAGICLGTLINHIKTRKLVNNQHFLSFDFKIFFVCIIASAFIAILRFFDWKCSGAWGELINQLRLVPVLSEKEKYVSLRSVWVWLLALSLYLILRRIIVNLKDIHIIFWSLEITSIIIAIFGIYSYISRHFMVSHYIYERRINATFSSPAVLADTFTAIFVIGIYLIQISRKSSAKILLIFALLMQITAIFLSGCRINFVLICIYLLILITKFIIKHIRKFKWYYHFIAAILMILLLVGGVHLTAKVKKTKIAKLPVISRILELNTEYKHKKSIKETLLKGRFGHWATAINIIKEYPIWGIGAGLFEQNYKRFNTEKDLFWYARTHCVPLRICAEGGIISLTAFIIFILLVLIKLSYSFTRRAEKKSPEWSKLTRTMFTIFLMALVSSFFTDIFYENIESIMFLSLLSVCGAASYSHIGRILNQHFLRYKRKVIAIDNEINDFFIGIGWEYLGFVKLQSIFKYIVSLILIILIILGASEAKARRHKLMLHKHLVYGFLNYYKDNWYIIGGNATVSFVVKNPVFTFDYKSFNSKTLQANQTLYISINGILSGEIPLNSILKRTIICDVSEYLGNQITIEFIVDKIFIPLDEQWFIDTREYGALITIPKQISEHNIKKVNDLSIKWLDDPDFKMKY